MNLYGGTRFLAAEEPADGPFIARFHRNYSLTR